MGKRSLKDRHTQSKSPQDLDTTTVPKRSKGSNGKAANRKHRIILTVMITLLVIALISALFLILTDRGTKDPASVNNASSSSIEGLTVDADGERHYNFAKLRENNPDIIGAIVIPNTTIDYIIVKTDDNSFYLDRDAFKNKNENGAIYMDAYNKKQDFTDPHTVLYGHNMRSGAMFAPLHQFQDPTFFKQNKEVYVYTAEGKYVYEIIAAYQTDNHHVTYGKNWENPTIVKEYLGSVFSKPVNDVTNIRKTELQSEEKILTLSTCIAGKRNNRYLVQALLKEVVPT